MPPISFAIRPPAFHNDSDEDEAKPPKDELLTDFDARRPSSTSKRKAEELVIASQPNKDWKKEAELLRGARRSKRPGYLPDEEQYGKPKKALTEDELAAADRMNDKTVVGGLKRGESNGSRSGTATPSKELANELATTSLASRSPSVSAAASPAALVPIVEETEDAKALRELLRGTNGEAETDGQINTIFQHAEDSFHVGEKKADNLTEEDIFRRDIQNRPDSSTMDDYARVPVEQFGAALLRGMGWNSDPAAREKRKPVEAVVPQARPALLGIGAKPLVINETSASGKVTQVKVNKRDQMHFVPLVKRAVQTNGQATQSIMGPPSKPSSRGHSTSPPPSSRRKYDSDRENSSRRHDSDRESRRYDSDRSSSRKYVNRDDRDSKRRRRSRSRSPDRRDKDYRKSSRRYSDQSDDSEDERRRRRRKEDASRDERRRRDD